MICRWMGARAGANRKQLDSNAKFRLTTKGTGNDLLADAARRVESARGDDR